MKTNNLKRRSFLTSMILMATALFSGRNDTRITTQRTGGSFWNPQAIYIPRRKKLKGWQKENLRNKRTKK